MPATGRKRLHLAQEFGRVGVWLALVLTVSLWFGTFAVLTPVRAALTSAHGQLTELDARLQGVQDALAPFDALSRPETLAAVDTLNGLAQLAQRTPVIDTMFGQQNLQDAVNLTAQWQDTLQDRPPLPALADARKAVQGWQTRITALQERLTMLGVGFCLLFSLLGAWFAAGQWALYQQARERLAGLEPVKGRPLMPGTGRRE
ncbi:hypothetical protein [Deinococcus fonticola]|uniref:hypothetical protein n=1 Tax=Deinococcus fonticola TaxID=2528713 RepID=UPI0010753A34|nr:hypothetical protein [Deinococcus fonticola]